MTDYKTEYIKLKNLYKIIKKDPYNFISSFKKYNINNGSVQNMIQGLIHLVNSEEVIYNKIINDYHNLLNDSENSEDSSVYSSDDSTESCNDNILYQPLSFSIDEYNNL